MTSGVAEKNVYLLIFILILVVLTDTLKDCILFCDSSGLRLCELVWQEVLGIPIMT